MSLHLTTRVPVDGSYATLVGKAVYVFAYYEWAIIWIIEFLSPGFLGRYCRGNDVLTSGKVKSKLVAVINDPVTSFSKVTKKELQDCCAEFDALIVKRNALIHAHPCTGPDGSQILAYQTKVTRPLPDMLWPIPQVEAVLAEFDKAACGACVLLDKLE